MTKDLPATRVILIALTAAAILATPHAALAACHIADFRQGEVTVDEDAGEVRVVVYLVGEQPTCSGEVRFETVDDTARAGADYRARSGQLTFTTGDDREETITVPIIDDGDDEPVETFMVQLSEGDNPGSISPTTRPATVSIRDDDEPEPSETETNTPTPTASPTEMDGVEQAAGGDADGGSSAGIVAGIVAAVLALGAGAWWFARRSPNRPSA